MRLTKTNIIIIGMILCSLFIPIAHAELDATDKFINYLNESGGIPIKVTTAVSTNWTQYMTSLILGSFFLFFFFGQLIGEKIDNTFVKLTIKKIKRATGRNVVFIKHTSSGMFNQSMIDQKTATKLYEAMAEFKGKDFDLILHTPGGEVFSALMISRILKQYPGKIRTIIPQFAMSGGTLLALSTDEIIMNETACLGPVDPQLGSLFKFGSAKSWDKIVKFKGKRAEDQSISFALEGDKYTRTIRNHLMDTIDFGMKTKDKEELATFLTSGGVEHAYSLTPDRLRKMGLPIKIMKNYKVINSLIKVISKLAGEGLTFV